LFGGCTGNPRSDFYQFKVDENLWIAVQSKAVTPNQAPSSRFCHAGQVLKNRLYIFGGYDGIQRLNDFYYFVLSKKKNQIDVPQSNLVADMKSWVANPAFSDITLVLEAENNR
jgi:hypothetical protein